MHSFMSPHPSPSVPFLSPGHGMALATEPYRSPETPELEVSDSEQRPRRRGDETRGMVVLTGKIPMIRNPWICELFWTVALDPDPTVFGGGS
eukprot:g71930.t1